VGVYLPLSTSATIYVGGVIRWLVDRSRRKELAGRGLTEEQLVAEGDKSAGVLLSSGYIAGGAIAGIIIAFVQGVTSGFDKRLGEYMSANNPLLEGPWANTLSLIPFAALIVLLYLVGRERVLAPKRLAK